MKQRKIPLRKCVACQEMLPKRELIRVVRTPEDETLIDLTGKKAGRGAYLCGKLSCFQLAKRARSLDRALKQPIDSALYDQLAQDFIRVEADFAAGKETVKEDA